MDRNLKFVIKHYRDGMFEINKSRAELNARIGKVNAGASPSYRARRWVLSMSMCAAIALFAVISVYYVRLNSWSEYTASDETVSSRLGSGLGAEASEAQEYQAYGNVRKDFFQCCT